jgi:thiamine pyrophosphate-dependent acetolactate synthase large subunit-like protein
MPGRSANRCCTKRTYSHFTADGGKLFRGSRVIQIDTHPIGLKHGRKAADIYVRADAKEALTAIIDRLPSGRPDPGWRSDALAREIAEHAADTTEFPAQQDLLDPRDAVAAIDRVVPKDWEIVNSSGHCAFFSAQLMTIECRKPLRFQRRK